MRGNEAVGCNVGYELIVERRQAGFIRVDTYSGSIGEKLLRVLPDANSEQI